MGAKALNVEACFCFLYPISYPIVFLHFLTAVRPVALDAVAQEADGYKKNAGSQ